VAQNIAYEIPLVVTGMSIVIFAGTLQMGEIVAAQHETLIEIAGISIPTWYAFVNPFAFVLFLVANFAEVGRNPFDTPEAPTEIVAGYQTEYSSVYFVLIYLGEFLHIFLGGAIIATIFLGGPAGPILPGIVWFLIKIWAVFFLTQWLRSAVPRVRIDQLIEIGWKGLLVLSFANLVLTAVIVGLLQHDRDTQIDGNDDEARTGRLHLHGGVPGDRTRRLAALSRRSQVQSGTVYLVSAVRERLSERYDPDRDGRPAKRRTV